MHTLYTILAIVGLLPLIYKKGVDKLICFIFLTYFFHEFAVPWFDYRKLCGIIFCFACISDYGNFKTTVRSFKFSWIIIILLLLHIGNVIFNQYMNIRQALPLAIANYCISVGVFLCSYHCVQSEEDILVLKDKIYKFVLVIIGFCLFSYLIGHNILFESTGFAYVGMSRGKLTAFQQSPNTHAMSIILPLLFLSNYNEGRRKYLLIIGSILCIILSAHRASYADFALGFASLMLLSPFFSNRERKDIRNILFLTIFSIIIFFSLIALGVINISDQWDYLLQATETSEDMEVSGSSLMMRRNQIDAAMYYFSEHTLWGTGIGYYGKFILPVGGGWNRGLLGMESFILWLLVEYGLFLIIAFAILILDVFFYFYKYRKQYNERNITSIAISILVVFVFHQLLNRPWGIFELAWPLLAACMREIEFKTQNDVELPTT